MPIEIQTPELLEATIIKSRNYEGVPMTVGDLRSAIAAWRKDCEELARVKLNLESQEALSEEWKKVVDEGLTIQSKLIVRAEAAEASLASIEAKTIARCAAVVRNNIESTGSDGNYLAQRNEGNQFALAYAYGIETLPLLCGEEGQ
jgi:hypothetical protein